MATLITRWRASWPSGGSLETFDDAATHANALLETPGE